MGPDGGQCCCQMMIDESIIWLNQKNPSHHMSEPDICVCVCCLNPVLFVYGCVSKPIIIINASGVNPHKSQLF